ncbi:hypothetical protein RO3G_03827 [Lichtheimia corymbifera JMRC:FSU:9682]|uniref:RNA-binding protein VTS1 n=1 Tax=Lichtheimia corymbifera JMRC:FSU:9682 TaxID=1263082 RepID=A0A068S9P7_9FUNG|nr:hypothetical protein RO3G_03827 [Lichtheimia corymbifera JMRC:FSU:9682]
MTSTHSSFLRSPLADAFTSMLKSSGSSSSRNSNNANSSTNATSTAEQQPSQPINKFPTQSSSSSSLSLKPPTTAVPSSSEKNMVPDTSVTAQQQPSSSSSRAPVSSPSTFQRNSANNIPPRPLSEVIRSESHISPEGEALRNLQEYERNLNSMASTNLDTWFKDDLDHVNKWFSSLNDVERTATVYGLLQQLNRVQIRFFMTILRQMGQEDPVESLLSPAYPDKADVMQAQLAGAMTKAEMEASQKFMSVLRPYRTPSSSAAAAAAASSSMNHRGNTGNGGQGNMVDHYRHSYALGEADEQHALFSSNNLGNNDFLSPRPASAHFGMTVGDLMPTSTSSSASSSRLKPTTAPTSPLFGSNARPRSVIEGDLSSIFNGGSGGGSSGAAGWSSFGVAGARPQGGNGGMVGSGMMDHRTGGRPKSADISSWSFGHHHNSDPQQQQSLSSTAAAWNNPLSPTRSTFLEHAKTIERPNSASDIDHHQYMRNNNFGRTMFLNDPNDNARLNTPPPRNRRPNSMIIPGTVPESDERQFADIVLSTYHPSPVPQKSTSASLMAAAAAAAAAAGTTTMGTTSTGTATSPMSNYRQQQQQQQSSAIPTSSTSATLATPYWDHQPVPSRSGNNSTKQRQGGNAGYGRFLNPNDYPPEDYLSDHSESSHMSGSRYNHRQQHSSNSNNNQQQGGGRKKMFGRSGGGGSSGNNKEKKYTDAVDMQLLEDVPAWLRSLRLHKYNPIFETMKWQEMIRLDDEALSVKGVAALGARRKMLKVFDQVKQHCDKNNIPY